MIANLTITSPKNVTAATWVRYFFLCTSSLIKCTCPRLLIPPGKFSEVCTNFLKSWISSCLELNRRQPAPFISSNYKKMWETTGCLYVVGQNPKGQLCVKENIMAVSLRIRCSLRRFTLEKTGLSQRDFVMRLNNNKRRFSLPYLAASSKVRYFPDNDSSGKKLILFLLLCCDQYTVFWWLPQSQKIPTFKSSNYLLFLSNPVISAFNAV